MTDETQTEKVPARLHAILARRGSYAVVFRRGPSDKVAVIGWDRSSDTFTLGQWLRGRIYPLRCDLSPSGKHLIYFAAKYGRENPMEKRICEELKKRFRTTDLWRVDHRLLAAGAEVDQKDPAGYTPLANVVEYPGGRKDLAEVITLLHEAGADFNAKTNTGLSILQICQRTCGRDPSVLELLKKLGAK